VVNATTRPLYPPKRDPETILQDTGWAPGLVQTGAESLVATRIRSPEHPVRSYLLSRPTSVMGQPLQVFSLFCQHLTFARTADYIPRTSYFTYDHLRKWSKGKIHPKTDHARARGGVEVLLYPFINFGANGVGGQRHAPADLPPGKTGYPLYRKLGGPKGRSGKVRKISIPPRLDPQIF